MLETLSSWTVTDGIMRDGGARWLTFLVALLFFVLQVVSIEWGLKLAYNL